MQFTASYVYKWNWMLKEIKSVQIELIYWYFDTGEIDLILIVLIIDIQRDDQELQVELKN